MTLKTLPNVQITDQWIQVSIHKVLIVINAGYILIALSDTQPTLTSNFGIPFSTGDFFENNIGGTIWAKTVNSKTTGAISVTTLE